MANEVLYWSDLINQPVQIAGQGRLAGRIVDFYYDPDGQSIPALRVVTGLYGSRVLLSSAIQTIGADGVTIANQNMLIDETNAGHLYHLPLAEQLIGASVVNERGQELGAVSQVLLGIYPPVALRISALEVGRHPARRISAHEILRIERGKLTVIEQAS